VVNTTVGKQNKYTFICILSLPLASFFNLNKSILKITTFQHFVLGGVSILSIYRIIDANINVKNGKINYKLLLVFTYVKI